MKNSYSCNAILSASVSMISNSSLRLQSNQLLMALFGDIVISLGPNVYIEIGAREADFSFSMSEVLPNTKFICYEANKHSFNVFFHRFEGKRNVAYLNVAISDSIGLTTIKIPRGNRPEILTKGNASLLDRRGYSKGYTEEAVHCTTLDESCLGIGADSTVCGWIDVEGHFRAVHKGGAVTFSRLDALFVEVEDHEFWEGQALTSEVCSMLQNSGMVAVARDRESDLQYNMIFVKDSLTDRMKPMLSVFFKKLAALSDEFNRIPESST